MNNPIIKVENISKLYQLGEISTGSLSQDLNRYWAKLLGKEDPFIKIGHENDKNVKAQKNELVWALKDISFELNRGEVLGIIGKNGAGKSTLLKILSQITSPTSGRIYVKGKISSLLEVGTGFHPELTGKENIFLNGAILGMSKVEINNKLEEIVEFAGLSKYIDTPVKRYSSGMYVRLAFAVAAHLEPDILIVDEVLAVGDAEFQKKAIGKMQNVSRTSGRSVLFVSHNMQAVSNLCDNAILLNNGKIDSIGKIDKVVNYYLNNYKEYKNIFKFKLTKKIPAEIKQITIEDSENNLINNIDYGVPYQIKLIIEVHEKISHFMAAIGVLSKDDYPIRTTWTLPENISEGLYEIVFKESNIYFTDGIYKLLFGLSSRDQTFQYLSSDEIYLKVDNTTNREQFNRTNLGIILNQMSTKITALKK